METEHHEGQNVRATWDHPYEGFVEPGKRRLIDLAFRLARIADPGFTAVRQAREIARHEETDYMGGTYEEKVWRLGDDAHGLEVTDRVSDPHDGMSPFSAWTGIEVYGLPAGYRLSLTNEFNRQGRDAATLVARVPTPAAGQIGEVLRQEWNAHLDGETRLPETG